MKTSKTAGRVDVRKMSKDLSQLAQQIGAYSRAVAQNCQAISGQRNINTDNLLSVFTIRQILLDKGVCSAGEWDTAYAEAQKKFEEEQKEIHKRQQLQQFISQSMEDVRQVFPNPYIDGKYVAINDKGQVCAAIWTEMEDRETVTKDKDGNDVKETKQVEAIKFEEVTSIPGAPEVSQETPAVEELADAPVVDPTQGKPAETLEEASP